MSLECVERQVQKIGGTAVWVTLAVIFLGLWRGLRRPLGRTAGQKPNMLRQPFFYSAASTGYFGLCYWLWRPFRLTLSLPIHVLTLVVGTLLYFSGLALVLWGRLALGQMYNVSSSLGAQLYADHQLITHGPFAWVRHPMYLGILLTGVGGLLLYRTWTFLFLVTNFPGLVARAWREEEVLAAEFGKQWQVYCQQVPAWTPSIKLKKLFF